MLKLKTEQFTYFSNIARQRFVQKMSGYFRSALPDEVREMDDAELEVWVSQGLALCERATVLTEPEAAQLIALLFVLGIDAEQRHDWVPSVVARQGLTAEGKVRAFIHGAREQGMLVDRVLLFSHYEAPNETSLDPQRAELLQQGL